MDQLVFSFHDLATSHSRKMDILSRKEADLLTLENICICRVSALLVGALLDKRQGCFLYLQSQGSLSHLDAMLQFCQVYFIPCCLKASKASTR